MVILQRLRFRFWPTLVFFIVFVVLLSLGVWQLYRYNARQTLLNTYKQSAQLAPVKLSTLINDKQPAFKRVKASGRFLNQQTLLLLHRFYQHKPGVEIITPFQIDGVRKILLVNRGWLPKVKANKLPSIHGRQTLAGWLKVPKYSFILGDNTIDSAKDEPLQIQRVNIQEISQILHKPLLPFVLRLDNSQSNKFIGFHRDWKVVVMKPAKHLGYAFQWFAMALALMIAFIVFSLQRSARVAHNSLN